MARLLPALAAALVILASADTDVMVTPQDAVKFPPDVEVLGHSYGYWAARYWQWIFGIPASINPFVTSGTVDCGIGQFPGVVWFLGASLTSTGNSPIERTCNVPYEVNLYVPLLVNEVRQASPSLKHLNSSPQQVIPVTSTPRTCASTHPSPPQLPCAFAVCSVTLLNSARLQSRTCATVLVVP